MAYAYHHPSNNQELIDPCFVVGFLPRSPGFIYRPILHSVQVLDPRLGVALQCHPSVIIHMDVQPSISLRQFMAEEGLVPSPEEGQKRKVVIEKLKEIVRLWIQEVARQRDLPENVIEAASATILTFGSYGLGVHGSESDIDALCIGPWFASIEEDFFIHLYDFLKNTPEVSDIYCIKGAKVPLMRFKLEGISVDLPYARLQVMSVPENVDLLNPVFLTSIDEVSWKSISGVRVNQCILQLVPNLKNFQSLLRCIKFWAKRRGVYGNLFGFLGGVHLAILAAFICQRSLNAGLSILVMSFFDAFAGWPWPFPVALQDGVMQIRADFNERRSWMPIRLPCTYEHCQSNITRSTFNRIKGELVRGQNITRNLLRPDFDWGDLFEPFVYQKTYPRFLKIYLSAGKKDDLVDWVGWVKSRFRSLILKVYHPQQAQSSSKELLLQVTANMNVPSLKTTAIFTILTTTFLIPIECSRITPLEDESFVTKVCKKTPYFDLCMTILFPDRRSYGADAKGLAKIVIGRDWNVAEEIQAQAWSLAHDGRKSHDVRSKCGKCALEYNEIVLQLIPRAMRMVDVGKYGVSIEELKDAARKAKACDEQFKGKGASPIINMSVHDISLVAVAIIKLI